MTLRFKVFLRICSIYFAAALFFLFLPLLVSAQEASDEQEQSESKVESLVSVLNAIDDLEKDIRQKSIKLKSTKVESIRNDLKVEIEELADRLQNLNQNFDLIASGVSSSAVSIETNEAKIDWSNELQELFAPLVRELKRLTNRPRALDRLKRKIEKIQLSKEQVADALASLKALEKVSSNKNLTTRLNLLQRSWKEERTALIAEQSIAEQKIQKLQSESGNWSKSIRELPDLFFKSRGRNLLLATLASLCFWWILRITYGRLIQARWFAAPEKSATRRAINLSYLLLSGTGAIFVFVCVLFLLGDWVLVILTVMLVLGLLWSSKQALPKFWSQAAVLLNVGPVREGERLEYNGVPYRVQTINLYSRLFNPLLSPTSIRIPVADLVDLRSRRLGRDEKWFPSSVNDWIKVTDLGLGQVISQSPSYVEIELIGGARKLVPTSDYPGLIEKNLSNGFRVLSTFGLDYSLQANITGQIREALESYVKENLSQLLNDESVRVKVEVSQAGASSLDFTVIADLSGRHAEKHDVIERALQRFCIDASNTNNWTIPFSQLTLHLSDDDRQVFQR